MPADHLPEGIDLRPKAAAATRLLLVAGTVAAAVVAACLWIDTDAAVVAGLPLVGFGFLVGWTAVVGGYRAAWSMAVVDVGGGLILIVLAVAAHKRAANVLFAARGFGPAYAIANAWLARRAWLSPAAWLRPSGTCHGCGYELRGLSTPRCPECGQPFDPAEAADGSA